MNNLKRPLIISLIAIILGSIIFVVGFFLAGCDINNLRHVEARYFQYIEEETDDIQSISINYESADLEIILDDYADGVSVSYPQLFNKKGKPLSEVTLSNTNGQLIIREKTNWQATGLTIFGTPNAKLTLTIPSERGYALSFETDNGDIKFQGEVGRFKKVSIETDNGDINTKNTAIFCEENFSFESDNGDILLGRITANKVLGETDNGSISVHGNVTANNISFDCDNGKIKTYGDYYLDGSEMRFETDNGDITALLFGEKNLYNIVVKKDNGSSNITSQTGGSRYLNIQTDNGDIKIYFTH